MTSTAPRPYRLSVPTAALTDLRARLRATRWPIAADTESWKYGADFGALRAIQRYWLEEYDWRVVEQRLNRYPQFLARIDGLDVHFFHVRTPYGNGRPLLLLHGWPGSQIEFIDMIDDLVDPGRCGRTQAEAFDLVIPAIPGFGFGKPPREPGWGPDRIADAFCHLMRVTLGYDQFGVQGGDWGAIIGRRMAQRHPHALRGLLTNMPYAYPPEGAERPSAWSDFHRLETAYLALQSTKPDAIALGQSDSPMGLATWILEKFASWSGGKGEIADSIPLETLITNIMFYWLPNSAATAARIYYESACETTKPFGGERVTVPTGVAAFAGEPYSSPRAWVEQIYDVVRWRDFERGGHFAALERPQELTAEIFDFFATTGPLASRGTRRS